MGLGWGLSGMGPSVVLVARAASLVVVEQMGPDESSPGVA